MLRECSLLLVLAATAALGVNIKVEWVEDSPPGLCQAAPLECVSRPRLVGLEKEPDRRLLIDPLSQQMAFERRWVILHENPNEVWFAASKEPRARRPHDVTHPVGTVYLHQKTGARGVVIGWDERTKAPREWVDATDAAGQYDWEDRIARLGEPHYSVLEEKVGDDGRVHYLQRYVVSLCRKRLAPPSCLEIQAAPGKPLTHPDLDKYFSHYDSERGVYVPNERLAALYPEG